jgi:hypothetical protein
MIPNVKCSGLIYIDVNPYDHKSIYHYTDILLHSLQIDALSDQDIVKTKDILIRVTDLIVMPTLHCFIFSFLDCPSISAGQ